MLRWNIDAHRHKTCMQMALFSLPGFLLFGQVMKYITTMFSEYSIYLALPSFSEKSNITLAIPFPVV
jgi:hypothetical protein